MENESTINDNKGSSPRKKATYVRLTYKVPVMLTDLTSKQIG